jgi:hypothetical protein
MMKTTSPFSNKLAQPLCSLLSLLLLGAPYGHSAETDDEDIDTRAPFTRFMDREYLLESGIDLPARFGISTFLVHSKSDLPVDNLRYSLSDDGPLESHPLITMDDLSSEITNSGFIFDAWLLPILNVYTALSYIDGDMDSAVNTPGSSQPIPVSFTGTSYLVGTSLVLGYKQAFLLLDYNYMKMDTSAYENKIPASNRTVRAGWNFDGQWLPEVAWLSYIQTEFRGTFDLRQKVGEDVDPGTVPPGTEAVNMQFEVGEYDTWALGAQWQLGKEFQLISEVGFDTVSSIMFALNYRFD